MLISVFVLPHLLLSLTVKKMTIEHMFCGSRICIWAGLVEMALIDGAAVREWLGGVRGSISRMSHARSSRGCWLSAGMSATASPSGLISRLLGLPHSIASGSKACSKESEAALGAWAHTLVQHHSCCILLVRGIMEPTQIQWGQCAWSASSQGGGGVSDKLWPLASTMWLSC